ncbi:hypothetical protein NDGK_01189 [Clostridiales bacterium CHKCI001]|nr:hypothetical protein NDGK_01189 [Clostridiales bacterium CHKCI001]
MSSDLKKLSNLFIALAVISGCICFVIMVWIPLSDWLVFGGTFEFLSMDTYLLIFIPIFFTSIGITIRRITEQISIMDKHLKDRIKELEEQLQKQINE